MCRRSLHARGCRVLPPVLADHEAAGSCLADPCRPRGLRESPPIPADHEAAGNCVAGPCTPRGCRELPPIPADHEAAGICFAGPCRPTQGLRESPPVPADHEAAGNGFPLVQERLFLPTAVPCQNAETALGFALSCDAQARTWRDFALTQARRVRISRHGPRLRTVARRASPDLARFGSKSASRG